MRGCRGTTAFRAGVCGLRAAGGVGTHQVKSRRQSSSRGCDVWEGSELENKQAYLQNGEEFSMAGLQQMRLRKSLGSICWASWGLGGFILRAMVSH